MGFNLEKVNAKDRVYEHNGTEHVVECRGGPSVMQAAARISFRDRAGLWAASCSCGTLPGFVRSPRSTAFQQ